MKKLLILLGCLIFILSACESKESKKLEGTWKYDVGGEEWATIKNGKMKMQSGTYKIKNSKTFENGGMRLEAVTDNGYVHSIYYIVIDEEDKNTALVDGEVPSTGETSSFDIVREDEGGIIKRFFSFIFQVALLVIGGIAVMILMDKIFKRNK